MAEKTASVTLVSENDWNEWVEMIKTTAIAIDVWGLVLASYYPAIKCSYIHVYSGSGVWLGLEVESNPSFLIYSS
jgi:hypothetical protein